MDQSKPALPANALFGLRLMFLIGGSGFVSAMSYMTIGDDSPTVIAPGNLLIVIPIFIGSDIYEAAIPIIHYGLMPCLFLAWCLPIAVGKGNWMPDRSVVMFWLFVGLSVFMVIWGWKWGWEYQGKAYAVGVTIISTSWWVLLFRVFRWARRHNSLQSSFLFHTMFFGWLAWYAIPYQGELP